MVWPGPFVVTIAAPIIFLMVPVGGCLVAGLGMTYCPCHQ
jgi:hypothetical protein